MKRNTGSLPIFRFIVPLLLQRFQFPLPSSRTTHTPTGQSARPARAGLRNGDSSHLTPIFQPRRRGYMTRMIMRRMMRNPIAPISMMSHGLPPDNARMGTCTDSSSLLGGQEMPAQSGASSLRRFHSPFTIPHSSFS